MDFKEYEELLNDGFRKSIFEMAHNKVKELYNDEFLVYPKCIFGTRRVTIYYISKSKIVVVTFAYLEEHKSNEFPITITEIKRDLLSKEISFQQNSSGIVELKLKFENDIELDFHNLDDSNPNWHEDFYDYIINIYKEL